MRFDVLSLLKKTLPLHCRSTDLASRSTRCFIAARDARAKVAAVSCTRHPVLSACNTFTHPSFDREKRHDEVQELSFAFEVRSGLRCESGRSPHVGQARAERAQSYYRATLQTKHELEKVSMDTVLAKWRRNKWRHPRLNVTYSYLIFLKYTRKFELYFVFRMRNVVCYLLLIY